MRQGKTECTECATEARETQHKNKHQSLIEVQSLVAQHIVYKQDKYVWGRQKRGPNPGPIIESIMQHNLGKAWKDQPQGADSILVVLV